MREVHTVIGCTPDSGGASSLYAYAVREWCINAAAVNPATKSIFVPSEDGRLQWPLGLRVVRGGGEVAQLRDQVDLLAEAALNQKATHGTADILEEAGLAVERVYKVKEGRPNAVDLIKADRIQLIINTPHGPDPYFDEKAIRRAAVTGRITTITTLSAARAAAEGIAALQRGEVRVQALQALHAERVTAK